MARTLRNNVDYFPHSVIHGKKMFYIRNVYGNDGYVVWFMMLEKLGKADFHYLDLSDKVEVMYLSAEFQVDKEKLLQIINTLVELGVFDDELWKEKSIIFNQKFVNNIKDAYKKRNNPPITKKELILLLKNKGVLLSDKSNFNEEEVGNNTQRKEEYSKVKNTKVKESIFSSKIWLDQICMKKKGLYPDQLLDYLKIFLDDLELKDELDKPEKDIKNHFINWLNIELKKEKSYVKEVETLEDKFEHLK